MILDGANTGAAALIAQALAPACTDYLLASHLGSEKSHTFILQQLGLHPVMQLDLRLGEASRLLTAHKNARSKALAAWDVLLTASPRTRLRHRSIMNTARTAPKVTDKTFDFYLHTMQDLDHASMDLASSGSTIWPSRSTVWEHLEQIAVETAGIIGDELPECGMDRATLCFTGRVSNPLQDQLTAAFTGHAETEVTMAHLKEGLPLTAAFDFGREHAEYMALSYPLLGSQ